MKRIFIILAFLLSCIGAFATEQLEDILWINDHIWHLGTPPMDFLDEDTRTSIERIATKPDESGNCYISTACMRGYIAEWTLQDNHLVLKAICDCEGNRIDMNIFMPYLKKYIHNGQVRADWIDGKSIEVSRCRYDSPVYLRFNDGNCSFSRSKSNHIPITVDEISEEETIAYQLMKVKPKFKGGDAGEFEKWVKNNINAERWYGDETDRHDRVLVSVIIEKDGTLTNARILQGFCRIPDEEIIKVILSSPKWTTATEQGKLVRVNYLFCLVFP